ncbi:UDP-4-amino-4,6-dideoxy-N-acetyl-beta-L-altrosamine N-acetyltransferase [Domibacillus epiphyticus]|uniref:UDP-4-amino-4, 6-dideoxy-N-acetyl-beta-L-altrosamine N-acetyltransferase n=1 Tax=Domibacillus epiphyticus TaxID=1714355 RepID=A0A1V2A477_9BACI|nr:UDP-4-amino-4,6-dideoxy-N-acetyl-beta-L-altrosamine N-acetyltransferase [Domibacillus epiphyticus]OMP65791.1 UDP-4-amino-4,6-dideoxy-N-acetyl-beta-L-altrosamine N-acetyltransferase [Domibacillus epiphyticus]
MSFLYKAELKDIQEKDLKLILDWRNQEWIRDCMYNRDVISMEQHVKWFEKLQRSETSISRIFYYGGIPYGILNVNDIDKVNKRCEWGFYIGSDDAPRGMGTILGFTSLNYIFNHISVRKICAEVIGSNKKSISFHQKMGFVQEGLLRKQIVRDGLDVDIVLYGMFKEEWSKKSARIQMKIEGRYV